MHKEGNFVPFFMMVCGQETEGNNQAPNEETSIELLRDTDETLKEYLHSA